jgi:5'-deoxynucleotidase YfbR-like HD superfamily hydrolase
LGVHFEKLRTLLAIHDICEVLTGDIDPRSCPKGTKYRYEEWAMSLLVTNPIDRDYWYEYSEGESLESRVAKMLDKLQFLLKMLEL